MSTTYLSIYDLLRITYTYESQAAIEEAQARSQNRKRADSATSICSTPGLCRHVSTEMTSSTNYAALETDFTDIYARKKRDSCVSIT
ncbi:hypothetical protein CC80DRAFT_399206 [Byssothecium circinans]|uniref:Uncharacterized protein n=1 Tax=Byssothecium circinans TaxID=147558 RepID=A0A6A5UDC8_9PLEO|nr:hypothetical protein CC80DRAFT_399206 [Byssothecium circinans]